MKLEIFVICVKIVQNLKYLLFSGKPEFPPEMGDMTHSFTA